MRLPRGTDLPEFREILWEIGFDPDNHKVVLVGPGNPDSESVQQELLDHGKVFLPGSSQGLREYVLGGAWYSPVTQMFDPDGVVVEDIPADYSEASIRLAWYLLNHRSEFLGELKERCPDLHQAVLYSKVFDETSPTGFLREFGVFYVGGVLEEDFLGRYLRSTRSTLEQEFSLPRPLDLRSYYGMVFLRTPEGTEVNERTEDRLWEVTDVIQKWKGLG